MTQAIISQETGLRGHPLDIDDIDADGIFIVHDRRPRSHNWQIKCRSRRTGHLLILARLNWESATRCAVKRIEAAISRNERQIDVQREVQMAVCETLLSQAVDQYGPFSTEEPTS